MKNFHVDTKHYTSWLENGVFYFTYKPGSIITLDVAKYVVETRLNMSDGIIRPAFVDVRGMLAIDKEARKYLAGEEALRYINAGAIYLNNHLIYLALQVFLKIDNPSIPSRLFTEKGKALQWLEHFKNQN